MKTAYSTDDTSKQIYSKFRLDSNIRFYPTKNLKMNVEPYVNLYSGRAQSNSSNDLESNSFGISEAAVYYRPLRYFELSAGALNQHGRINNPLLMSNRAFPGIEGKLRLSNTKKTVRLTIASEITVPTSQSLETNARQLEPTPFFTAHTMNVRFSFFKRAQLESWITHFNFEDLPMTVAEKSGTMGNTVKHQYYFKYPYEGVSLGSKTSFPLYGEDLEANLAGRFLQNFNAPSGLNSGHELSGGLTVRVNKNVEVAPSVKYFRNEPDSSPAYYNSSEYGHNNRHGYAYILGLMFKKWNFGIFGEFVDSHLIYKNPYQSRRKDFSLSVGLLDVRF